MTTQAPIYNAIKQGAWQHKEQWEHWASLFHCAVVPMNDLALSLIKDAHTELKKSTRYKQMVKKNAKAAMKASEEYERMLYLEAEQNHYGDRRNFLMDYMDSWQDYLNHDIEIFKLSVSKYLLKLGFHNDNRLMTLVFVAQVLTDYACQLWDGFWKMCKGETGKDLSGMYREAKLTAVANFWSEVANSFDPKCVIHLDDDHDCQLSMEIISNKATSPSSVRHAGEKALDLNEDVKQWAEGRDAIKEKEKQEYFNK